MLLIGSKRELIEEAGNIQDSEEAKLAFQEAIDALFDKGGTVIYRGYVDDPRSTDNAWIETTAFHFHCPPDIGAKLPLGAGDDAKRAIWLDINPASEERYANLYASHRQWVDRVAETIAPHELSRQDSTRVPPAGQQAYPPRLCVADDMVPWSREWPEYAPVEYTDASVLENYEVRNGPMRWADAPDPTAEVKEDPWSASGATIAPGLVNAPALTSKRLWERLTFEGDIAFEQDATPRVGLPRGSYGRPLNPRGRTGLAGRGLLGKWGPNHAADPIVTRWHPSTNKLQVVVVKRQDGTDEWSLPGRLIREGETMAKALREAFEPRAVNYQGQTYEEDRTRLLLDQLFDMTDELQRSDARIVWARPISPYLPRLP